MTFLIAWCAVVVAAGAVVLWDYLAARRDR